MFQRNIKITKGEACQLMIESTQNLQVVCEVFRKHIHSIRKKNRPQDPNFLKISIACGKVEQFIESIFPSQKVEDVLAKSKAEGAQAQVKAQPGDSGDTMVIFGAVATMLVVIAVSMVSVDHGLDIMDADAL